jgi:uncharacterized protein YlxW (UPF0749 family)
MNAHFAKIRNFKPISRIGRRQLSLLITSVLVGFLIILQARSFTGMNSLIGRDTRADVFREITILKTTNEKLQSEITDLEDQLSKSSNNEKALEGIQQEIEKYRILTGRVDVYGPGISMTVTNDIRAIWLTDIVNELLSAGAEAVSVNGIRLTDSTSGFDTIPSGQIVLNGSILKAPFVFLAIGDKKTLSEAIEQPQGILQRLRQSVSNLAASVEEKDFIKMAKVL